MLFCWAPAELLLLFLPPRPRADSLSKQALSLPTGGKTAFRTDAVGLHLVFFLSTVECLRTKFLFLEGGFQESEKPCRRITGILVFQAVVCSSFSVSDTRGNSLKLM